MRQQRIMVGFIPLDAVGPPGERWAWGLLSAEERIRAERRVRASSRLEFTVAHALKRLMLAEATGADPMTLRFAPRDEHGKPALTGGEEGFDFNLSHTAGAVACAVVSGGGAENGIGIDLEAADRRITLELADRFFAADETGWIRAQPQPDQAFLAVWTLKEAFVKAAGRGLALGLTAFSVRPPPDQGPDPQPARLLRQEGEACLPQPVRLWQWLTPSGHRVGLGLTGPEVEQATVTVRTGWPGLTRTGSGHESGIG